MTVLFTASLVLGVDRGIRRLSNFNMVLFGGLMLATLVLGPTVRVLELSTQAVGGLVGDFFRVSLYTNFTQGGTWANAWTVFYWAWPLAWSPFAGLFIARISRAVDAPADAAWTLLADTGRWPEWGPSVRGVESSDRRVRTGTTGRVRTRVGAWLPFEVTACDGDGGGERRWRWRVAGVPATEHRVVPGSEEDTCRVEIGMPLAAGLYAPVCALALVTLARVAAEGRRNPE